MEFHLHTDTYTGIPYMLLLTGRSLGQMMSRSSVRISRVRLSWLILVLMHAGMSASMVDKAFLLLRSREEAWRGDNINSVMISQLLFIYTFLPKTSMSVLCFLFLFFLYRLAPYFLPSFSLMCCFSVFLICGTLLFLIILLHNRACRGLVPRAGCGDS